MSAAEPVSLEKEAPTRSPESSIPQSPSAEPGSSFDPFVDRLFGGASKGPPESAAGSVNILRLKAPVLQRAQRLYGNRASQQIVMRARALQRQCNCGGTCAKCQEEEEQRALQRSSAAEAPAEFDELPTTGGEPLSAATRHPLEAHFGADLADVRVHTGSEAADSASKLDALAYTSGRDIYFAPGMYAPTSDSGGRLLAHEVAHVVQQGSGKEPSIATKSSRGVKIGAPDDILETEADQAAAAFMSGTPLTDEEQRKRREAGSTVQRFIQRQDDGGAPAPAPSDATPTPAPESGAAPIDKVIAALQEPQENGVGNYPAAFGILNGLWIVDMMHTLEQLTQRGYFDLLRENSPDDTPRVQVAIAAVAAKGNSTAALSAAHSPAFGAIEDKQQHEVATYLGLPWPIPQASSTSGEGNITTGEIVGGILIGAAVVGTIVFFVACPACVAALALITSLGGEVAGVTAARSSDRSGQKPPSR